MKIEPILTPLHRQTLRDHAQATQRAKIASERLSSGAQVDNPTQNPQAFFRAAELFEQSRLLTAEQRALHQGLGATEVALQAIESIRTLLFDAIKHLRHVNAVIDQPLALAQTGRNIQESLQQIAIYSQTSIFNGENLLQSEQLVINIQSADLRQPEITVSGIDILSIRQDAGGIFAQGFSEAIFNDQRQFLPENFATDYTNAQGDAIHFDLAQGLDTLQANPERATIIDNLISQLQRAIERAQIQAERFGFQHQLLQQTLADQSAKQQDVILPEYRSIRAVDDAYETSMIAKSRLLQDAGISSLSKNAQQHDLLLALLAL